MAKAKVDKNQAVELEPTQNQSLDLAVQVNRDDVVAIGVAAKEERVEAELKVLRKTEKEIQKRLEGAVERQVAFEDRAKKELTARVMVHLAGMTGFVPMTRGDDDPVRILHQGTTKAELSLGLGIGTVTQPLGAEYVKICQEISEIRSELEVVLTNIAEKKYELSNIGRYERKIRGVVAKHSLEKSEVGRALLDKLQQPLLGS